MKLLRRTCILWMLLMAGLLLLASCGNDNEGDTDTDNDNNDDDNNDDDDDSGDDDAGDDDAGDDDDDDDNAPFPNLDPTVCMPDEPVDIQGFDPDYAIVDSGSWVQNKNYYLLTIFSDVAEALAIIKGDPDLALISTERDARIRQAATDCVGDIDCYADALLWSDVEAMEAADALVDAFFGVKAPFDLASSHLQPSGMFHLHVPLSDDELLRSAWLDTVAGMHQVFDSYGWSLPPAELDVIINEILSGNPDPMLLFEPMLEIALAAMDYYDRDEAGRYEPMQDGENRSALARIPTIDWEQYRFSIILVPGKGPNLEIPFHPTSKIRCDLAVERFNVNIAPLIVLSGGHVHPDQTPYSEAIEMKKYLMQQHGIPEEAILVDPHARHTTTNLRNVSRLIFRYGIPPDKPALITTDFFQNIYIAYMLTERCLEELGYLPWRKVKQLGFSDSCLLPSPTTLYADPRDPLDP